ncbi:branched-chain amino acid ABC transporter permease [Pinisolibacter aquiterrae]|uniref:branched-chain amino acid ABC transporter permease n=1 Tax=Pinisolibacter aquiterrae TaxID=2815579 RepID=UPI001C3D408F|nr:branched-chain amino acid ABC transporter permease [Pinisolibacter aquiterrae]MBV5262679.1 branched-chain amino acid ABC transporter permease [Pinisolibacter aquiterrae]MCC8236033.1 branched-chain amino acid ABC transporter permease [Pinisolibacter aquiterrae]
MTLLSLVVSGLALGSIYALIGVSLVIISKATDVVNFGQGEMAMFGAFLTLTLLRQTDMPLWLAVLATLPIGFLLGALVQLIVVRPIENAPALNVLISTLGLFFVFNSAAGIVWGFDPHPFPSLFELAPITVGGVAVTPASLGIIAVALSVMFALYLFFEKTRWGTAMRAASMNRTAARMMGIRVEHVAVAAWGLAGGLSVISAVLIAPLTFLDQQMMVSIILKGFAGAILGGFSSLPGSVIGCLILGVAETLFGAYVSTSMKDSFAFVLIILVLLLRPSGVFVTNRAKKV